MGEADMFGSDDLSELVAKLSEDLSNEIDDEIIDEFFQVNPNEIEEALWLIENYVKELCPNVTRPGNTISVVHRGWHVLIKMWSVTCFRISDSLDELAIFERRHNWVYQDLYEPNSLNVIHDRITKLMAKSDDAKAMRVEINIGPSKMKWSK